jgi:hypothetical protein
MMDRQEEILKWILMPQASMFLEHLTEIMDEHLDKAAKARFERMSITDNDPSKCETGESVRLIREALSYRITVEKIREAAQSLQHTHHTVTDYEQAE